MTSLQPRSPLAGKRVVFVFGRLDLGGAERQGLLLAQYLRQNCNADVRVVGLKGELGRLADLCQESGIPCRSLFLGQMHTRWQWLKALFLFTWQMRRARPDVLISYTKNANVLASLAWRCSGARGFVWNQADEGIGMERTVINRLSVALTQQFISNSEGGRLFLQRCYTVADERVSVIHNGIALAPALTSRLEWRRRIGVGDDDFVACMVANISRFKDHATLIKAWRHVLDLAAPQIPLLLLAGRPDGPEDELFKLAEELGLGDRIRFLGAVADVSGLFSAVDLFVYSSVSEGLPNAVVEAMASGLPVVGTDIPGIREALGVVQSPYLAPVGDAIGLAEAIMRIVDDPERGRCYGEELRQRAVKVFSLPVMLERSALVLTDVMRSRSLKGR